MRQTSTGCSAEREFRRNLWITTFEEAIKLSENIPAVGYKFYPWGARAPQKCPIDLHGEGTAHETAYTFKLQW